MMTAEITQPENKDQEDIPYPFQKMNIWFEDFDLKKPERETSNFANVMNIDDQSSENDNNQNSMYPSECRIRSLTYSAPLYATVARKIDNEPEEKITMCLG
jgi:DNA-directed RNA polymerase beta subunit